jgi:hypothetical protein
MKPSQASDTWFQSAAARDIHMEQLKRVELFNGQGCDAWNRDRHRDRRAHLVLELLTKLVSERWLMATPHAAPNICRSASEEAYASSWSLNVDREA